MSDDPPMCPPPFTADPHQGLLDNLAESIRALLGFYDAPIPADPPPGRGLPPCCITIDDDGTARWL